MMNLLTYLLVKKTFWETVQYEIKDLIEITYDALAGIVGEGVLNMFLIGVGALVIMLICLKVINR